MTTTAKIEPEARIVNRADLYESGYDLPTYLAAPICPTCGRLYCYCPKPDTSTATNDDALHDVDELE